VKKLFIACVATAGLVFKIGCSDSPPETPPATIPSSTSANVPVPGRARTVPELGIELVYVKEGAFLMGGVIIGSADPPVRSVKLTRGFWLGKYEVSQKEYEALTGKNPSRYKGATNPVETVSWFDADAYCKKLTARERDAGRIPEGYEYRLPSEAEWEYAARGGFEGRPAWDAGTDTKQHLKWHLKHHGEKTHPTGAGKANSLGLYDMTGNVAEWCRDWHDPKDPRSMPVTDPIGAPTGKQRICRGGLQMHWDDGISPLAFYDPDPPENVDDFLGFRVALGPVLPEGKGAQ
jgi:formylglycine-generating enzyme required for sulfatase activity